MDEELKFQLYARMTQSANQDLMLKVAVANGYITLEDLERIKEASIASFAGKVVGGARNLITPAAKNVGKLVGRAQNLKNSVMGKVIDIHSGNAGNRLLSGVRKDFQAGLESTRPPIKFPTKPLEKMPSPAAGVSTGFKSPATTQAPMQAPANVKKVAPATTHPVYEDGVGGAAHPDRVSASSRALEGAPKNLNPTTGVSHDTSTAWTGTQDPSKLKLTGAQPPQNRPAKLNPDSMPKASNPVTQGKVTDGGWKKPPAQTTPTTAPASQPVSSIEQRRAAYEASKRNESALVQSKTQAPAQAAPAPAQAAPAPAQAAPAQAAPRQESVWDRRAAEARARNLPPTQTANPAQQAQQQAFEAFKAQQAKIAPTSGTTTPQPATIGTKIAPTPAAPAPAAQAAPPVPAAATHPSPAADLVGAKPTAPNPAVTEAAPAPAAPAASTEPTWKDRVEQGRDMIRKNPLKAAGGALAAGAIGSRMIGGDTSVNIKAASIKQADGMSHVLNTVKAEFPGVEGIIRHSKAIHAGHAAQAGDPLREALPAAYTGLGLGALKATATVGSLTHIGSKLIPNRKQEAPPINPPVGYDLPSNYGTPNPAFGEKVAGLFLRTSDLGDNPTDIINALDDKLTNGGKSFRKVAAEDSVLTRIVQNPRVQGAVAGAAIASAAELVDLKLLSPIETPEPLNPNANYYDRMKHTVQEARYNIDRESRTNVPASAALAGAMGAVAGYRYGPEVVGGVKHVLKRLGGNPVETP